MFSSNGLFCFQEIRICINLLVTALLQPTQHVRPVTGLAVRAGGGAWVNMDKCENFMFCKPPGFTLHASFGLRVVSDTGTIDVTVERRSLECSCDSFFAQVASLQGDTYIDMGSNNDGSCGGGAVTPPTPTPPPPPTTTTTAAPVWGGDSVVDCSLQDGLYPDPSNCRGFIKCAQVTAVSVAV